MKSLILENSSFYIRLVLFLTFLGHGFVSLGFSPSMTLHYNIIEVVNFTSIPTAFLLKIHGFFDIFLAFLILTNRSKFLLYFALSYLIAVSISAMIFYWENTGSAFGVSEFFRRLPWIFLVLFLVTTTIKDPKYHFIRIGLSFAFISHGLASLGFLGLNQGHIDLAMNIISPDQARTFITYTGITDTIIGLMLLQSIYSKHAAFIAMFWTAFIVYLSYLTAWPDGMFRTSFFLIALYVFVDKRTHLPKLIKL